MSPICIRLMNDMVSLNQRRTLWGWMPLHVTLYVTENFIVQQSPPRKIPNSHLKMKSAMWNSALKGTNSNAKRISPGRFSQPSRTGCSTEQPEQKMLLKAAVKYFSCCLDVRTAETLLIRLRCWNSITSSKAKLLCCAYTRESLLLFSSELI